MTNDRGDEEQAESRRILERMSQEAATGGTTVVSQAANRARKHLTAEDVDRSDWTEYWGTRIGRTIGVLFLAGLIFWLVLHLAQGD